MRIQPKHNIILQQPVSNFDNRVTNTSFPCHKGRIYIKKESKINRKFPLFHLAPISHLTKTAAKLNLLSHLPLFILIEKAIRHTRRILLLLLLFSADQKLVSTVKFLFSQQTENLFQKVSPNNNIFYKITTSFTAGAVRVLLILLYFTTSYLSILCNIVFLQINLCSPIMVLH